MIGDARLQFPMPSSTCVPFPVTSGSSGDHWSATSERINVFRNASADSSALSVKTWLLFAFGSHDVDAPVEPGRKSVPPQSIV